MVESADLSIDLHFAVVLLLFAVRLGAIAQLVRAFPVPGVVAATSTTAQPVAVRQ